MESNNIDARFFLPYQNFTLDVELTLPSQGITAIFGHSGSGKTSFLRCMAGLAHPKSGRLVVQGQVWQDQHLFLSTHQRPLGYVFQEPSLFAHLSAMKNLEYALKRRSSINKSLNFNKVIDLLNIRPILHKYPHELSGGERQRVAIARALLINPKLLLMDEPLASLDLNLKKEILPYIEQLRHELQIPIFYVSHSIDEVARLADHIVVLEDGRCVHNGTLSSGLTRFNFTFPTEEERSTVIKAQVAGYKRNWELTQIRFEGGDLWLPGHNFTQSLSVRVKILAKNIVISLTAPDDSSNLNVLPAIVDSLAPDEKGQGSVLVRLKVGEEYFVTQITKHSVAHLNLVSGMSVWAQVGPFSIYS